MLERARKCEALIDARPGLYFSGYEPIGGQPLFLDRAEGAYIWDIDGNRYIDFLLGYGTAILGHAHPVVTAAATAALERGVNPTLLSVAQVDLAEKLVDMVPCAEQVTFLKSGSDAVSAAVRLARAVTGRKRVLQWGHHGWHDWCAFKSEGVQLEVKDCTIAFSYNDIDDVRKLFGQYRDDVACVVMMPYEIDPPEDNFLLDVQELARANGALFVLDEVRSGFRIALGGAQEYFGLNPDLAAFSKAMANGHAISVLAGRRAVMQHILKIGLTVTYYRSPDSMAASLATLRILEEESAPVRLAALGKRLIDGLNAALKSTGVQAQAVGFPATPFIRFNYKKTNIRETAMRLFCSGMLQRGVLLTPSHHWFLCTATREIDVDYTVRAAADVFADLERKL